MRDSPPRQVNCTDKFKNWLRYQAIRRAAPYVAARYTWDNILEILFEKICLAGERQRGHPFRPVEPNLPIPS